MTQTTPEEPTIISPPETEAKPYTPPAKKSHVPAGMEKLIFLGATLLVALVAVVVVFSHKMDPKATANPAVEGSSAHTAELS